MPTEGLDLPIPRSCCVFVASPSRGPIAGSPMDYVFDTHIRDIPSGCPLYILIPREPRSLKVCYLPRAKSWGLELAVRATEQVRGARLMPQFPRSLDFGQAAHKEWEKRKSKRRTRGHFKNIFTVRFSALRYCFGRLVFQKFTSSIFTLALPSIRITKTLN